MSKNESEMFSNKTPVLTFDTDWAPDYAIDYVVKKLEKWNIRATWFVTHDSQVIQKLKNAQTDRLAHLKTPDASPNAVSVCCSTGE